MQRTACGQLRTKVREGMTYDEVVSLLGPGSLDWPRLNQWSDSDGRLRVVFNVRSWYHNGLEVEFKDGHVVNSFYYD